MEKVTGTLSLSYTTTLSMHQIIYTTMLFLISVCLCHADDDVGDGGDDDADDGVDDVDDDDDDDDHVDGADDVGC